ncbi:GntR family transcriptional regulator [Streptomyces sp. LARHCF249]
MEDEVAPTPVTGRPRGEAAVFRRVRDHVRESYAPGDLLDPLAVIARHLGLPHNAVRQAVRQLDTLGEVAICRPQIRIVLSPGQMHPRDLPLVTAVRARIRAGCYRSGQALPTGLLGQEFGLRPEHVRRACTHLRAEGLLRRDPVGPHGPAHYVT